MEIRKTIRLSVDELQKIEQIREEKGFTDFTKTFCYILQQYFEHKAEMQKLEEENRKLQESNEKQMTRIRLASNGADVNVQILMEVLNTMCWQLKTSDFQSTEQMIHPTMEQAQKTVRDRIARFKQAKEFREKGKA